MKPEEKSDDPGAKAPQSKEKAEIQLIRLLRRKEQADAPAGKAPPKSEGDDGGAKAPHPKEDLKKASDPEVKAAAEALLGKEESDPGGKALNGDSSDEDDAMLAERLHQASIKMTFDSSPRGTLSKRS